MLPIAAGLFGSALAPMLSNFVGGIASGVMSSLAEKYGSDVVSDAMSNSFSDRLQQGLADLIQGAQLPLAIQDLAMREIENIISDFKKDVPAHAQSEIDDATGSSLDEIMDNFMELLRGEMREESKESTKGSEAGKEAGAAGGAGGAEGAGGGGGGGNWLIDLAKALGRASGKHLENVIELGKDLGEIDAKEDPAAFAEKQAEFQAANQIFKMFQEAISTLVKSIGEAINTLARKQ